MRFGLYKCTHSPNHIYVYVNMKSIVIPLDLFDADERLSHIIMNEQILLDEL